MNETYAKILTANDLGLTGSHQGGVCIPHSNKELISFLPKLDTQIVNPNIWLKFKDTNGKIWHLRYIYYNGRIHKTSTRNEYRITYLTPFYREFKAEIGDSIVFSKSGTQGIYAVSIEKPSTQQTTLGLNSSNESPQIKLRGWRRIH